MGPFNLQKLCPECVHEAWSCHEESAQGVSLSLRPGFPHGPTLDSGHHVPNSPTPPDTLILLLFFLSYHLGSIAPCYLFSPRMVMGLEGRDIWSQAYASWVAFACFLSSLPSFCSSSH